MINNLIDSLEYTIKSSENLLSKEQVLEGVNKQIEMDIVTEKAHLNFIKGAKEKYTVAVNELYKESIEALQNTLNVALKYIMYDKNYSAKLVLEDKRGTKSLSIMLVDDDDDFEVDLKDGVGQGVRTIISFVLKSYYLLNQNSRVLFLDEKYSALSSHYVPRFYEFIEKFCEDNDFIIVLISHIDNQIEHANKVYYLNDGVISEESIDLTETEK
jgi:ABC-type Na+ transport system ATPase subunit NatA